jgi:putative acetyltransferase
LVVRPETSRDFAAIREVNVEAFKDHPFSEQTEHLIVEALRAAGALEISLVAEVDGRVVGHVAFSRASVGDASSGWYLLGPIAVLPECQGQGVGRSLIEAGLDGLRARGALGCVLVGDPDFYRHFGFSHCPGITCHGVPDENVLCLPFASEAPSGEIVHHPAFSVTA